MNRTVKFVGLLGLVALSACTARYKLDSSLTENGFLASRNIPVGTVFLWPRGSSKLQKVGTVEIGQFQHPERPGRNSTISFSSSAEYAGGASLTEQQKIDAGIAIQNKSQLQTEDEVIAGYSKPVNALIEAIRGNPSEWHAGLEVEDGVPENAPLVVFFYEVVKGKKLALKVDGATDSSAEFPLEGIAGANVKFKVINSSEFEISSSDPKTRVPLYLRAEVFEMKNGANGPTFSRTRDDILKQLSTVLARGT